MMHSLIPSLPFSLRYPRDTAFYPETSKLSVFPVTQSHHHATNAIHAAASHLAPFAGRCVPVCVTACPSVPFSLDAWDAPFFSESCGSRSREGPFLSDGAHCSRLLKPTKSKASRATPSPNDAVIRVYNET